MTAISERWRWFKVLRLNRCRRPRCWKVAGLNLPGNCDEHQRQRRTQ